MPRMWMVDPATMCDRHLIAEHHEVHVFAGSMQQGKSLAGYLANGLLSTTKMETRHAELVEEMTRRGFEHRTPLTVVDWYGQDAVTPQHALRELHSRCTRCREAWERR